VGIKDPAEKNFDEGLLGNFYVKPNGIDEGRIKTQPA